MKKKVDISMIEDLSNRINNNSNKIAAFEPMVDVFTNGLREIKDELKDLNTNMINTYATKNSQENLERRIKSMEQSIRWVVVTVITVVIGSLLRLIIT